MTFLRWADTLRLFSEAVSTFVIRRFSGQWEPVIFGYYDRLDVPKPNRYQHVGTLIRDLHEANAHALVGRIEDFVTSATRLGLTMEDVDAARPLRDAMSVKLRLLCLPTDRDVFQHPLAEKDIRQAVDAVFPEGDPQRQDVLSLLPRLMSVYTKTLQYYTLRQVSEV